MVVRFSGTTASGRGIILHRKIPKWIMGCFARGVALLMKGFAKGKLQKAGMLLSRNPQ